MDALTIITSGDLQFLLHLCTPHKSSYVRRVAIVTRVPTGTESDSQSHIYVDTQLHNIHSLYCMQYMHILMVKCMHTNIHHASPIQSGSTGSSDRFVCMSNWLRYFGQYC